MAININSRPCIYNQEELKFAATFTLRLSPDVSFVLAANVNALEELGIVIPSLGVKRSFLKIVLLYLDLMYLSAYITLCITIDILFVVGAYC